MMGCKSKITTVLSVFMVFIHVVVNASQVDRGRYCLVDGKEVCCTHYIKINGTCKECPLGFQTTDNVRCIPCKGDFFGRRCSEHCKCAANEICDHVTGNCTVEISKGTTENSDDKDTDDKTTHTVLIVSVVIATVSLVVVVLIVAFRLYTTKLSTEKVIKSLCKGDDENPTEREKNEYGSYQDKELHTYTDESDEYEFDSDDDDEEEEQYAMLRESQMISAVPQQLSGTTSPKLKPSDKGDNTYDTTGYNHLCRTGAHGISTVQSQEKYDDDFSVSISKRTYKFQED